MLPHDPQIVVEVDGAWEFVMIKHFSEITVPFDELIVRFFEGPKIDEKIHLSRHTGYKQGLHTNLLSECTRKESLTNHTALYIFFATRQLISFMINSQSKCKFF